jgi:hypothetical protein
MAVPAGGDTGAAMGELLDGGAALPDGAALFDGDALLTGGRALPCALAGGAGSALGLPTRGAAGACVSPLRLPGPNKSTWPTEMRNSDPMLFHRARSR